MHDQGIFSIAMLFSNYMGFYMSHLCMSKVGFCCNFQFLFKKEDELCAAMLSLHRFYHSYPSSLLCKIISTCYCSDTREDLFPIPNLSFCSCQDLCHHLLMCDFSDPLLCRSLRSFQNCWLRKLL